VTTSLAPLPPPQVRGLTVSDFSRLTLCRGGTNHVALMEGQRSATILPRMHTVEIALPLTHYRYNLPKSQDQF
jgi:hypothetical protein